MINDSLKNITNVIIQECKKEFDKDKDTDSKIIAISCIIAGYFNEKDMEDDVKEYMISRFVEWIKEIVLEENVKGS